MACCCRRCCDLEPASVCHVGWCLPDWLIWSVQLSDVLSVQNFVPTSWWCHLLCFVWFVICIVARFLVMVQYLCCFHWEAHDDLVVDLIRLHAVRFRFWDLFIWNLWISWRFAVIWFAVCYLSCSVRYNHCWSCVWFVVCNWEQWCSLNTIRILWRSSAIAANTWVSLKLVHNWRIDSIDDCNNLPLMNVDSVLFVSFWFGCSVALVVLCGDCTVIRCPSDGLLLMVTLFDRCL